MFLNMSCTLAVFDIEPPVGQTIEAKYHEASIRCVMVPIFTLVLRGIQLIHDNFSEATQSRSSV